MWLYSLQYKSVNWLFRKTSRVFFRFCRFLDVVVIAIVVAFMGLLWENWHFTDEIWVFVDSIFALG